MWGQRILAISGRAAARHHHPREQDRKPGPQRIQPHSPHAPPTRLILQGFPDEVLEIAQGRPCWPTIAGAPSMTDLRDVAIHIRTAALDPSGSLRSRRTGKLVR